MDSVVQEGGNIARSWVTATISTGREVAIDDEIGTHRPDQNRVSGQISRLWPMLGMSEPPAGISCDPSQSLTSLP